VAARPVELASEKARKRTSDTAANSKANATQMPPGQNAGFIRQLSMAMELPFVMIGSVLIGGGLGYLLDRVMHTAPLMMLIVGGLGFAAGVWAIIKRLTKEEKRDAGNGQA
jgi:F0F1-type ATP synthase assembly protein I